MILTTLFTVGAYAARVLEGGDTRKLSLDEMRQSFVPGLHREHRRPWMMHPHATHGGPVVGNPIMAHPNAPRNRFSPMMSMEDQDSEWSSSAERSGLSSLRMDASMDASKRVIPKKQDMLKQPQAYPYKRIDMLRSIIGKKDAVDEGIPFEFVKYDLDLNELPAKYDPVAIEAFFLKRPKVVAQRRIQITKSLLPFGWDMGSDQIQKRFEDPETQKQRGEELRQMLTSLGPFAIKLGQGLAVRPDILPLAYTEELKRLYDKVPTFDSKLAMRTIRDELGKDPEELFSGLSEEPLAAASLGQVYKGKIRTTGEDVAIKVQRPYVLETVLLDLYIVRQLAMSIENFPKTPELVELVDEIAGRFYEELDYRVECENGIRMAKDMAGLPKVLIPKAYPDYTSRRVLTAEWVEGEKLATSGADDVQGLVNVGVVAYMTQLLGTGFLHADPHPGNMIRTADGRLAILDFGLVTSVTEYQRTGFLNAIIHFINHDYSQLGSDFQRLGFIPVDVNAQPLEPALTDAIEAALQGKGLKAKIDFNVLARKLARVSLEYPGIFQVPPYFVLVVRAIGVLEGIALKDNPNFNILDEVFPYVSQRLLTADNPELQDMLREFIYGADGIFDAERLIELLSAFESFDGLVTSGKDTYHVGASSKMDEDSKVEAALSFFFSENGKFSRDFILDESVRGYDVLTRDALQRLRGEVPALGWIVPAPVRTIVPKLNSEEERTLRNTKALLEFFLGASGLPPDALERGPMWLLNNANQTITTGSQTINTVQQWEPVLQKYRRQMIDFGLQVVTRLNEVYAIRFVRGVGSALRDVNEFVDSIIRNFNRRGLWGPWPTNPEESDTLMQFGDGNERGDRTLP